MGMCDYLFLILGLQLVTQCDSQHFHSGVERDLSGSHCFDCIGIISSFMGEKPLYLSDGDRRDGAH